MNNLPSSQKTDNAMSRLTFGLSGLFTVAAIGVVVALIAGCGSSSSGSSSSGSSSSSSSTATKTTAAATNSKATVTLSEMKVVPSPTSAKAGEVTFNVKNAGSIPHEMVVIKTSKQADQLGTGSRVPETGSVGETGDIPAGKSKTLKLKLAAGHYALICNVPGHYSAGMHADFNVSG